jgi:hypothetical protein
MRTGADEPIGRQNGAAPWFAAVCLLLFSSLGGLLARAGLAGANPFDQEIEALPLS